MCSSSTSSPPVAPIPRAAATSTPPPRPGPSRPDSSVDLRTSTPSRSPVTAVAVPSMATAASASVVGAEGGLPRLEGQPEWVAVGAVNVAPARELGRVAPSSFSSPVLPPLLPLPSALAPSNARRRRATHSPIVVVTSRSTYGPPCLATLQRPRLLQVEEHTGRKRRGRRAVRSAVLGRIAMCGARPGHRILVHPIAPGVSSPENVARYLTASLDVYAGSCPAASLRAQPGPATAPFCASETGLLPLTLRGATLPYTKHFRFSCVEFRCASVHGRLLLLGRKGRHDDYGNGLEV